MLGKIFMDFKLEFIGQLHLTHYRICHSEGAKRPWESPVIKMLRTIDSGDCHVASLLAMTVVVGSPCRSNEPGGPNGVSITACYSGSHCPWGHPR